MSSSTEIGGHALHTYKSIYSVAVLYLFSTWSCFALSVYDSAKEASSVTIPTGVHHSAQRVKQAHVASPRIFCMILTTPGNYHTKAEAVKTTWARRCTGYGLFYTRQEDRETLPDGFPLDIPEGREHLTAKVLKALQISYRETSEKIDWFLKADDDTYVIMENLKYILSRQNPEASLYIGGTSSEFLPHGYNGGGAGYVLSKEAARMMIELGDHFGCTLDGGFEDLEIGRCLSKFRVFPVNTRDEENRLTFHPDHPLRLLEGHMEHFNAYTYTRGNVTFGRTSVSV